MAKLPFPRWEPDSRTPSTSVPADCRFPPRSAVAPFACQHGTTLLLLEVGTASWTLAELRFDDCACSYVEVRRSHYAWPREAAGALLGRVMAYDPAQVRETAERLSRWVDDLSPRVG